MAKKETLSRKKLVNAAKELNKVIGPDTQIDLNEASKGEVQEYVFAVAGLIDPKEDEFTDATLKTLQAIEAVDETGAPTEDAQKAAGEEEEDEDEEEEDGEEEEEDGEEEEEEEEDDENKDLALAAQVTNAKKLKDLKAVVDNNKDTFSQIDTSKYKGLQGFQDLKADVESVMNGEEIEEREEEEEEQEEPEPPKKSKGKKQTEPKAKSKTRGDIFVEVLEETREEPKTKEEFAEALTEHDDTFAFTAAKSHVHAYFPILRSLGLLEKQKDGYIYKG